ncbi:MAG: MarC family integral membrane protein [Rhodanobacteraceae bacterium]|jgi:small neutral amino acid transporter SnatA (MarC family)|nr:MAG: MarC family integral membrane protein [Rhodanobacteraceae bacterium]
MHTQMTIVSACITLFLVLDAPGNVPFFLSVLKDVPPKRRRWVMIRELLIALGVLVAFLVGGRELLSVMQLRQEAIAIGGGVVLFLIAIKMVFPPKDGGGIFGPAGQGEPFIVPLAIPGVAGPSAMATLLLLTSAQPGRELEWGVALLVAWLATAVILLGSTWLFKFLGESVLAAMERVMGMLLIALAAQMILGGVEAYLKAG